MKTISRRDFLYRSGLTLTSAALGTVAWPNYALSNIKKTNRVVIVGGGFGGATCAKYIRRYDPSIEVTLIERSAKYVTCPFSNLVLGGLRTFNSITHDYTNLTNKHGVHVVHAEVTEIDPVKHTVTTNQKKSYPYESLIVSPGIDFKWHELEGYDASASRIMPHAWKAGEQTLILQKELQAMKDGGVIAISAPANPFRCPPGPYERASLMAHYLKSYKPKSKIVIMDSKAKFSKQALFMQGWETLYPGMIDWVDGTNGGRITEVDIRTRTLVNELGDVINADILNVIPPQKAGLIAHQAGLTDQTGWCPVNQKTFESSLHKDIHVIGDASLAGAMPKSGFSANSQAKVCAAAIVSRFNQIEMPEPTYNNTCYSLLGPDYAISVAAVYRLNNDQIVPVKGSSGVSPKEADLAFRKTESRYTQGWYTSIIADTFS